MFYSYTYVIGNLRLDTLLMLMYLNLIQDGKALVFKIGNINQSPAVIYFFIYS